MSWTTPADSSPLEIAYRAVKELKPDPRNPRTHPPKQIAQIARNIDAFGFVNPILLDDTDIIIAGHGRLQAAIKAGLEHVPTITLRDLTDAQKKRFKEGCSGNLSGRPRSKHVRAVSSRQYRRDVLQVTEELIPAKTASGVKLLPFHVVNLLSIRAKASQGHAPSQRYLDKLHREAIEGHEEANPNLTDGLEREETNAVNKSVDRLEGWEWRNLNLYRKFTWRL